MGSMESDNELDQKALSVIVNWRDAFNRHPVQARQAVQGLIQGRLTLRPNRESDNEFYEFEGVGNLEPILAGVLRPQNLASPTGSVATPC
jgi:hypothetical protein